MKTLVLFLFALASCTSSTENNSSPFGDKLSYTGTGYFQNEDGSVTSPAPATLRLIHVKDSSYLGVYQCGDVKDVIITKLHLNGMKLLELEGFALNEIDSAQFVAQEYLQDTQTVFLPHVRNLPYYLPHQWRMFDLVRD